MGLDYLVTSPLTIPMFGAFSALILKKPKWKNPICLSLLLLQVLTSLFFVLKTYSGDVFVSKAGGWAAPVGIIFVVDTLSAGMLLATALVFVSGVLFCLEEDNTNWLRLPLLFFLQAGANLSLVTGDFFNLFVAFEIMLSSSYALMALEVPKKSRKFSYVYFITGSIGSFLFLTIVALLYGQAGTLNMAEISLKFESDMDPKILYAVAFLAFLVYGIKAGVFPFYFWVPDCYSSLPASVAAIFSGIITKVAIYVIIRVYLTLLPPPMEGIQSFMLVVSQATMLLGVIGALSCYSIRRILSYHIVSQIGYMVMGLAFFTPQALLATLLFIWHNMFVKASLFMFGSVTKSAAGSDDLKKIGGMWNILPLTGTLLLLQILSMAGMPPFSGFWGKYLLIVDGIYLKNYFTVTVSIVTSFLTLLSMVKIFSKGFWGKAKVSVTGSESLQTDPLKGSAIAGPLILVAASLFLGIAVEPMFQFAKKTAYDLHNKKIYQKEVLG